MNKIREFIEPYVRVEYTGNIIGAAVENRLLRGHKLVFFNLSNIKIEKMMNWDDKVYYRVDLFDDEAHDVVSFNDEGFTRIRFYSLDFVKFIDSTCNTFAVIDDNDKIVACFNMNGDNTDHLIGVYDN